MAIRRNINNSLAAQTFIEGAEEPIMPATQSDTVAIPSTPPKVIPSTMLIRFNDPAVPALLAAIAEADDRSKHHVALKAIALGLEELRKEYNL